MPTDFQKAKRRVKLANGNWSKPISYLTSSESVEMTDGSNLQTTINNKVDKVTGKDLSTNDYTDADKIAVSSLGTASTKDVGTANGVAELDSNGKVPSSQLPSYVDDVIEGYYNSSTDRFYKESTFTTVIPPEDGKSWVDISTNKSYRWTGSVYVRVDEGVQLGETSSTAYRGDRGKTAYDHSQTTGNPHGTTKSDVGLGNVDNTSDLDKPISTAAQTALNNKVDKATGKGLSTNDYTNEEKQKNADNASAIEDIQEDISTSQTATGNPITIESSESNLVECTAEVEAEQDLHGYDHPWVGGAGENKIDENYSTSYTNAVKLQAGTYYYQGFVEGAPSHTNTRLEFSNDNSTWKMVGVPSTDSRITTSGWDGGWIESGIVTMTFTTTTELYFRVWIVEGTLDNRHLSISSEQLTTFAPYSNISPITGQTEVVIEDVGKNILPMTVSNLKQGNTEGTWSGNTYTIYGISYKVNTDDGETVTSINCNGTSANYAAFNLVPSGGERHTLDYWGLESGVLYVLSGTTTEQAQRSDLMLNGEIANVKDTGNGVTISVTSEKYAPQIRINPNTTISNYVFYPMIRKSTDSATFEPYKGKTYTIQLGDTIYGGELDVLTGKLRVTHGEVVYDGSSDEAWSSELTVNNVYRKKLNVPSNMKLPSSNNTAINALSNQYVCKSANATYLNQIGFSVQSDGTFFAVYDSQFYTSDTSLWTTYLASNPLQVVYELAEPYTIQLTPQQIRLLKGTNNISCNTGDLSIKYYPDNVLGQLKGDIENEYDERVETLEEKVDNAMQKGVDYVTAGQLAGSTLGAKATAEGSNTVASKENSHAEGSFTTASGFSSHAEGGDTLTSGSYSHAEGTDTSARGDSSHAEGNQAVASGNSSHAEGNGTTASGLYSHAEGDHTSASGNYSHAEGSYTIAPEPKSHAEGTHTHASGNSSHAEGDYTSASGNYSHAEGDHTTASNFASHAGGHYNAVMTTGGTGANTTGTAFVIGNGVHISALSNAFSVQYNGVVKAASTITASTTADYAEFFEWFDENSDNEDRVGLFVTNSEEDYTKIRIANSNDDYILGIVSGNPFVLGNGDCDVWNGMMIRDDFGRVIYEPAQKYEINPETEELEPVYDDEGNPVYEGTKPVYNPEYDPTIPYISRFDRPEWSPIGMLGVLRVYDDGTCEVGGYCTVGEDGKATKVNTYDKSTNCYKVIERITDDIIKVIFR